jgi:homoserine kinase type II
LLLDNELYEIEEYIEGEPYDHDRPAHLAAAARTLGTFHTLVEGFGPGALSGRPDLYHPQKTQTALDNLLVAWQTEDDPTTASVSRQLQGQIIDLADRFAIHGELPRQVIHGDFYAGNLLFDGDRVVGVVDYDKANWQPRVAEVAEALIFFSSPRKDHLKHIVYPGFLEKEPFARFLQYYAGSTTLEKCEVGALPDYVGCIWLSMSFQRLLERHRKRPAEAELVLKEALALGTWAVDKAQQMRTTAQMAMSAAALAPQEDVL